MQNLVCDEENTFALKIGKFKFLPGERKHIKSLELEERPEIVIYGRKARQGRDVQFFSDDIDGYYYSGVKAKAKPLTDTLRNIMQRVNTLFDEKYNGILINRYNDGTQYIGRHKDNEKNLGKKGVVSISVGATRTFRITDNERKVIADFPVEDCDIMVMEGDFQKYFYHEVLLTKEKVGVRWSLTFRYHEK